MFLSISSFFYLPLPLYKYSFFVMSYIASDTNVGPAVLSSGVESTPQPADANAVSGTRVTDIKIYC